MTHNFKTGMTYKYRDGRQVTYIGDGINYKQPIFEYEAQGFDEITYCVLHIPESEILGIWGEEQETIDVANMWVTIRRPMDGDVGSFSSMTREKPQYDPSRHKDTIAIIRVSEWEAIKRGERKLTKGEGL